jgi:hypothetical protein
MSNSRRARDLIWMLVTHKSSELETLRQAHFGDAPFPTLDQLRDAWKILAHLQLALEIADQRRWQQIEAAWRALGDYPDDDDHLEATAPTENKSSATLPFGGGKAAPPSSGPIEPHPALGSTQAPRPRRERTLPFRAVSAPHAPPPPIPVVVHAPAAPSPKPTPPVIAGSSLSLQEYAMLCATREVAPERLSAALSQFGLNKMEVLDLDWQARLRANGTLQAQYDALTAEFKEWLASQA